MRDPKAYDAKVKGGYCAFSRCSHCRCRILCCIASGRPGLYSPEHERAHKLTRPSLTAEYVQKYANSGASADSDGDDSDDDDSDVSPPSLSSATGALSLLTRRKPGTGGRRQHELQRGRGGRNRRHGRIAPSQLSSPSPLSASPVSASSSVPVLAPRLASPPSGSAPFNTIVVLPPLFAAFATSPGPFLSRPPSRSLDFAATHVLSLLALIRAFLLCIPLRRLDL